MKAVIGLVEYTITGGFFWMLFVVLGSILGHDVLLDEDRRGGTCRRDLTRDFLEQIEASRDEREPHAFRRKCLGDAAADAHAGARDERGLSRNAEIHGVSPSAYLRTISASAARVRAT